MKCSNCGQENVDGNKFCCSCGAPLQTNEGQGQKESFPENGYPQYSRPEGGNSGNPGAGNMLMKIFGVFFTVLYGISLLRGLYGTLVGLLGIIRGADTLYVICKTVSSLLTALSCALLCVTLLLMAFCKEKSEKESGMYGLVIAGILRAAAALVTLVLFSILHASSLWYKVDVGGCFQSVLYALVTVGVMVLISVLTGELNIQGRTMEDIKRMVSQLPGIVSNTCQSMQQKGSTGAGNGTNYGNGYMGSHTSSQNTNDIQGGTPMKPAFRLKTDRSLGIYILLTIVTCGIYSYYFLYTMARDANTICEGDGENTGGLLAFILLSVVTCGIYGIYWKYKLGNRLAQNGPRYGLMFQENGSSVLLWHIFGIVICGVGPFIAMNILIKNMNRLSMAYNQYNGL